MTVVKRNVTFDVVKSVAIFTVLWGHVIQYLSSGIYYENRICQIIYSFHMPLFMIVVGFFSIRSLKRTFGEFMLRKFVQLLMPSITITMVYCMLMKCTNMGGVIEALIMNLWFLKAVFLCYFLFYCCMFAVKSNRLVYLVIITLLSQFVFIYQFNLMFSCFMFGVILQHHWEWIKHKALPLALISGIIFIMMLIPWDDRFWIIPSGGVYPLSSIKQFESFLFQFYYRMLIGIVGSIFFIMLSELICLRFQDSYIVKHLSVLGKETLGIYLLQTILIETLLWRWLKFDDMNIIIFSLLIAPVISVLVLYLCLICIKVLRLNRVSALFFLGERHRK